MLEKNTQTLLFQYLSPNWQTENHVTHAKEGSLKTPLPEKTVLQMPPHEITVLRKSYFPSLIHNVNVQMEKKYINF